MENNKIGVIGLKGLPAFGGAATVGENIINNLKNEYDFTIYSISSHTNKKTGIDNGIKQIVFNKINHIRLNTLYYYILSLIHCLFYGNYNLIHLHHSDAAFIIPFLRLKYNVIVTTHGAHISGLRPKWKKYKWFFQSQVKFLSYANTITCVSKIEREFLKRKISREINYIPNGVNLSENNMLEVNKEYDIFFGAGRIIKSKGCDILLKALKKSDFKGRVIIAGDLDQTIDYKNEILELSRNLNIQFIGLIKDKQILLSTIKKSKIFVFPSSQEAMSMMLLEGASVNTPIICSDIIENKDIFNEEHVLFFKTDDITDLSEKINYAFENYEIMIKKSKMAYIHLINSYNWSDITEKYSLLFKKILK